MSNVRTMLLATTAMLVASAALVIAEPASPVEVRYTNGKLWLKASDANLDAVLAGITRETAVRFMTPEDLSARPITIAIDGSPLERAIATLLAAVPEARGHAVSYAPDADGNPRPVTVSIFGATDAPTSAAIDERARKMIAAGVPPEIAEKAISLAAEARQPEDVPAAGRVRPEDLSPDSRRRLERMLNDGVPVERALRTLVLQERYQETLRDLSKFPGGPALLLDAANAPRD